MTIAAFKESLNHKLGDEQRALIQSNLSKKLEVLKKSDPKFAQADESAGLRLIQHLLVVCENLSVGDPTTVFSGTKENAFAIIDGVDQILRFEGFSFSNMESDVSFPCVGYWLGDTFTGPAIIYFEHDPVAKQTVGILVDLSGNPHALFGYVDDDGTEIPASSAGSLWWLAPEV